MIKYQISNIYLIASVAVIGGLLFGADIASLSAIIPARPYKCYFNQVGPNGQLFDENGICWGPNSATQGGISAAMPAGSWLGAIISGFLTDRLGRRMSIGIGSILWVIGSAITASSMNIGQLCAGRVINGLCVGIASAQVPVYLTELSPPTKRGRIVGLQQWAITWGIMIFFYISCVKARYAANFNSYGTVESYPDDNAAWRIPWSIQAVPAVFLFFALFIMPESPRWLGSKGRWEECHAVLTSVHGKGNPDLPLVQRELAEIRELVELDSKNSSTYWELFNAKNINRTHVGLFTQIWSQLTGMNVMMYYISYVFQMAGKTGSSLLLSSSIQYVINVVMTVPALLFQDRWGRRPTMLVGSTLMMIWMFTNAGLLSQGTYRPDGFNGTAEVTYTVTGARANALIACTYLFVASYAPTWGPVSWTYPPELYPLRIRGKANALATSGNWAFNTALGAFVPVAFRNTGWRVYCIFGTFLATMTIHVFFFFPETSGKTLEQVREIFEDPNGPKYIGTPAWRTHNSYRAGRELERAQAGMGMPHTALTGDLEKGGAGVSRLSKEGTSDSDSSRERHVKYTGKTEHVSATRDAVHAAV